MEKKDFIVGEKFIDNCDYRYFNAKKDFNVFKTSLPNPEKEGIFTLYTHIHMVPNLFKDIQNYKTKFILVTHNSDHSVDENIYKQKPKNIVKWFSQNVCYSDKNLISLPIGLENERWWVNIKKKEKMISKLKQSKNYKNLLYMNHSVRTNPRERTKPYQLFGNKSWCTSVNGSNGNNFDGYIDNIYNHKFVLCPNGNGVDTHRLWETLYLKSIPIVKKSINVDFYDDLPILKVDRWEDINEELLNNKFEEITNGTFNEEKLKIGYWLKKLNEL